MGSNFHVSKTWRAPASSSEHSARSKIKRWLQFARIFQDWTEIRWSLIGGRIRGTAIEQSTSSYIQKEFQLRYKFGRHFKTCGLNSSRTWQTSGVDKFAMVGPPDPAKTPKLMPRNRTPNKAIDRGGILQSLRRLGEIIAQYEELIAEFAQLEQYLGKFAPSISLAQIERLTKELEESGPTAEIMANIKEIYVWLRTIFISTCEIWEQDKRRRNRIIRRNLPNRQRPEISDLRNATIRALPQAENMMIDGRLEVARQESTLKSILAGLAQVVEGGVADVELLDRV